MRSKKRIERLRSGGGKDITETAIMKGLNWLKSVQDEDGGWGNKDKDDQGNPKSPIYRDAMTGMALLAYLGHCELQDSPTFGPTVQKGIDFLTSTPLMAHSEQEITVLTHIPYAHMLSVKHIQ